MKVIDKPLLVGGYQLGVFQAYSDIEPEFVPVERHTRVLPAPFFYEKKLFFYLHKVHAPGAMGFPNGGYEVIDEGGALRNYDLDQIIVHPAVLKHSKMLAKMKRSAENGQKRGRKSVSGVSTPTRVSSGKRGRKPLDPDERLKREAAKAERATRSGNKRGRPASTNLKPTDNTPKTSTRRRGRPALSDDMVALKAKEKAARNLLSGGLRGRPKRRL
jgi:hypothetical protein